MQPNKDVYRVPYESPLDDALREADAKRYTPETQPEAYAAIKAIEQSIETMRNDALASVREYRFSVPFLPFRMGSLPPKARLIEREATVGGALLPQQPGVLKQRFWYHDGDDWFYEVTTSQKTTEVIRFQTSTTTVDKLYGGTLVPFSDPSEPARFVELVKAYNQAIRPLYVQQATEPPAHQTAA